MTDLSSSSQQRFWLGALHILPLCLAVLPWGVLAGSMAVSQGFTPLQSVGLSVFVFAGAAQLVTISMVAAGSGFIAICLTILVITAQHLLYAPFIMMPAVRLIARCRNHSPASFCRDIVQIL